MIWMQNRNFIVLEILVLLVILALAAYLRLHNAGDNPRWYTDEATHLNIAQNLLDGKVQYMAVDQSVLMFGRMPLFGIVLAGMIDLFGANMTTLRTLTGILGVLTVFLLYLTVRLTQKNRLLPLLAAGALAIYPEAVLYSRFGFSYALLSPLVVLTLLGLVQYWSDGKRVWLALAAGAVGIGITSDLMMASLLVPLALIVLVRRPLDLVWSLPLLALPFGIYAVAALTHTPDAFWLDLDFTLYRMSPYGLPRQIDVLIENYTTLLRLEIWFPLGLVGLFTLRPLRLSGVALALMVVPVMVIGRSVALYSLSYYYITPLLPLLALGVAGLIHTGGTVIWRWSRNDLPPVLAGMVTAGVAAALIGVPLADSLRKTIHQVQDGYTTAIEPFLVDPDAARQVADHINARTVPGDLVITTPVLVWMLDANAVDFQMSVAATGLETVHMPASVPEERFVFDTNFRRARYVVVDDIWRTWGMLWIPTADDMLREVESWPLELDANSLKVYRNPDA